MSSVRRYLVLSFLEKYSSLLITIISTMVMARLLTPVETGIYSVASGIVNIAQVFRDVGVPTYILQERDLTRSRLATSMTITLIMGIIVGGAFAVLSRPIGSYFNEPRIATVVLILSVNFLGVAFASISLARLRRAMNFAAVMRIGVCCSFVHASTSIVLGSLGYGPVAMAWAAVLGIWTAAAASLLYFPRETFLFPSLKEWRRVMHIGAFVTGGYLLQEIGQRATDILVGRMLGFGQAGLYSRGNGLITLFEQAFTNAIISVAQSDLARINRGGEEIRGPFLKYLGSTTAVAWPVLGMMAILALPIIYLCFGDQWLAAIPVAQILCLGAAFMIVGQLCISLFTATGTVRRSFVVRLLSVPLQIALLSLGCLFDIESAAWAMLASNLVFALISLHQLHRILGASWGQILRPLAQSLWVALGTTAIPIAIVLLQGLTTSNFILPSLAIGASGTVSWLAMLFLLRHPLRDEVILVWRKARQALVRRREPV